MALCLWKSASAMGAASLLCACQLVSGLNDLDATEGNGSGGGAGAGGGSSAESSSGAGAGGQEPCPKQGCELVVVDNTIVQVDFLATDGVHLFWANRGVLGNEGGVWRAPLDESEGPTLVVASLRPQGLVFDPMTNVLFWPDVVTGMHHIRSVDAGATDGAPAFVYTADTGESMWRTIAISPVSKLFWVDAFTSSIRFGLGANTGSLAGTGAPQALAVDDLRIYWYDAQTIWWADHDGNNRSSLSSAAPSSHGITVDGTYAFWTERTVGGRVMGIAKGMQGNGTIVAAEQTFPTHVFSDGTFVYWASEGALLCSSGLGQVSRRGAHLQGDEPEVLATEQRCPSNFVKAGGSVYWGSGKRIYRVTSLP